MGIKEEVLSEKMKHCENPINFFSYYYLDKTEDRLTEKDLEYDFGLMIDKTIQKCNAEEKKFLESCIDADMLFHPSNLKKHFDSRLTLLTGGK